MIDFSAPLTEDKSVSYRFNALYRNEESFRDFDKNFERIFVAPTVAIKSKDTDLTFNLEYARDDNPADFGTLAFDGVDLSRGNVDSGTTNAPSLPKMITIIFGLNLLIPLIAIAFNNKLSAWAIFVFGSLVTAFGSFHSLEHAMEGEIYTVVLTFLTLTLPGIYGVVLAYRHQLLIGDKQ